MKQDGCIFLNEGLLIGKGGNQTVYINPKNPAQCIKISNGVDNDHRREMKYRRSRELRHLPQSALLTGYYGSVETNLGTGYVFERIVDFDEAGSKTLEELIKLEIQAREEKKSVKEILGTDKR